MDECPACGYVDKAVGKLEDIQKIVFAFKKASGVPADDKEWNKMYFRRFSGKAKELLKFFEGDYERAGKCIEDVYRYLTSKGLTVTLETVIKHAAGWKIKHPIEAIKIAEELKKERIAKEKQAEIERWRERERLRIEALREAKNTGNPGD